MIYSETVKSFLTHCKTETLMSPHGILFKAEMTTMKMCFVRFQILKMATMNMTVF